MMMMFFLILTFLIIMMVLMMINFILMKKKSKDREKISSFECGFDLMSKNRLPFSLQFYLISIIFLIFDIEIALILPFIYMNIQIYYSLIIIFFFILLILLIGLYIEWMEGSLKWIG